MNITKVTGNENPGATMQTPTADESKLFTFRAARRDQVHTSWLQSWLQSCLQAIATPVARSLSFITQRSVKENTPITTLSSTTSNDRPEFKHSFDEVYYDALSPEQWDKQYRKLTLSGASNQLMQWVVFNDKTNSSDLGVSKKPIGDTQLKQLISILSDLKKHYPDNTPTVHLVYEIFQPELLHQEQKKNIHIFFKSLENINNNLKVIPFCDIKEKAEYGKTASDLRLQIIRQEETGFRKKLWLLQEFSTLMHADIRSFTMMYGDDINQIWPNMLKSGPWLSIFDGQGIVNAYDPEDRYQVKMFDEFKKQLDHMTPAELHSIEACKGPQPLTCTTKALYIDLQRCVLLNDSDIIQNSSNSNGGLIYRDFDTQMSAAMPDITLKPSEVLGVPDLTTNSYFWKTSLTKIVENAVMGVACPKNPTIQSVIKKTHSEVIESTDPDSIQKNNLCINNYNYIYNQLADHLVGPLESTFFSFIK